MANIFNTKQPTNIFSQENRSDFAQSTAPIKAPEPFAATPLGITTNTILGIPKATVQVLGDIFQGITSSIGSAGVSVAKLMGGTETVGTKDIQSETGKKIFRTVFGTEEIKSLEDRVAQSEIAIKDSPLAQKLGVDKMALPFAFLGVVGSTALDFTPFGGEKVAIKQLIKETTADGAFKILKSMKISDDVAKSFAPRFAESNTDEAVKGLLGELKLSVGNDTLISKGIVPGEVPKPPKNPIQEVTEALKDVEPLRAQQETLYSAERAAKLTKGLEAESIAGGGEAGYIAKLRSMTGEMAKVQFDDIRSKLSPGSIDSLYNEIKNSPLLTEWDKISAGNGLSRLFGQTGTTLPTEGQLQLLSKVFPEEFIKTIQSKQPLLQRLSDLGFELANLPKSAMSTGDLSFGLRQGLYTIPSFPKQWASSFADQFKWFGSKKNFQTAMEEIASRPSFDLMGKAKLALTDVGPIGIGREEAFQSTWIEKIPVFGALARASSRAYTGFANKLRADIFDDMVSQAMNIGRNPYEDIDLAKDIASFINNATGRGSLGKLEQSGKLLSSLFFSPRLISSRLNLLLTPATYLKADPFVRKQAWKSYLSFLGTAGTVLTVASLSGAKVGTNPNSSDFGKIIVGDTRVDVLGGFQQYVRAASQILSGKYVSSTTGKETILGQGYKPVTRWDIVQRFAESKLNPAVSAVISFLRGQDYSGQPVSFNSLVTQRMIPLALQDITDIIKENPKLFPIGLSAFFGTGVQTYEKQKKDVKGIFNR
jgi:hypothetical protein